jgi:hypothetical protein
MCKADKELLFILLAFMLLSCVVGALQAEDGATLMFGETQPSLQNSGQSLTDSVNTSEIWNGLYRQGQAIYEAQRNDLTALRVEISSLRIGYGELTNLSERLSRSNEDLRGYNLQIAERMQQRDEDLALAYAVIDEMEKTILKMKNTILKLSMTIGILALVIVVILIILLKK